VKRLWLPIACALLLVPAAASASQTTIVGTWRWSNGSPAVFAADGTVRRQGQTGQWERQGNRYVITWFDPQPGMQNEIDSIDTVTLSPDGTALHGAAGDGSAVNAALLSRAQMAVAPPVANRSAVAYAPSVSQPRSSAARPAPARALAEYTSGGSYGATAAASAPPPASAQSAPAAGQAARSSTQSTAQVAPQSAAAPMIAPLPAKTPTIYITAPGAGRAAAPSLSNGAVVEPNLTVTPSQVYVPGNSSALAYATVTWVMANPPTISDPTCVNGPTNAIAANGAPGYMGPIAVVNWTIGSSSASITISAGRFVSSLCTVVISTTPTGNWTNPMRAVLTIRT
jgi:hypothetical protein